MSLQDVPVLVTGTSGLIGSHLTRRLVDEGARVRASYHRKPPVVEDPRIEYVQADLTQPDDCRRVFEGIERAVLCAASTHGAATIQATPMIHVTPNVIMNALTMEAAYEAGCQQFVYMGSTVCYPVSDQPVTEDMCLDGPPFEKYFFAGWAKRFCEIMMQMYGEKLSSVAGLRGMNTISLRVSNVYGPHDRFGFKTSHVLPALIRKVVERWDPLEVWGTGEDVRDVIYVDDFIEAILRSMTRLEEGHHAINIGYGEGFSVNQLLAMICEADGFDAPNIVHDPSKPTMIPKRLVDVSKAREVLDWRADTDVKDGIAQTIRWYREHLHPYSGDDD